MLIRLFYDFKMKGKINHYFEKQMILFFKYLYLIIFATDLIIIEKKGIYSAFGKLTIFNLFKKLQNNYLAYSIGLFIIIFTLISLIFLIYVNEIIKFIEYDNYAKSRKKKITDSIFAIFRIFYFVFVNFTIEIILAMIFDFSTLCIFQAEDHIKFSANNSNEFINCNSSFNINVSWAVVSIIYIILILIINYFINLTIKSCNSLELKDFKGEFDKSDKFWMFLLAINIFVCFEIYFQINIYLFYLKLALRICFILYFLFDIRYNPSYLDITELFYKTYCFLACLGEFIYIKDFLNSFSFDLKVDLINHSSINFSQENIIKYPFLYYYTLDFMVLKIIIYLVLAYSLVFIKQKLDYEKVLNFVQNTKNPNGLYEYYSELFIILYKLKNESITNQVKFHGEFFNKLKNHIDLCKINYCQCSLYRQKVEDHFYQISKNSKKFYENFIISFIEINLNALKNNPKLNNSVNIQVLILDSLFNFYFKKFYVTSFFNLEKLLSQKSIKFKKSASLKLKLFKMEIISSFIENNNAIKNGKNQYFKYLYTSFNSFLTLQKIQENSLKSFELYRDVNNNLNQKICDYNYNEFKNDLNKFYTHILNFDKKIHYLENLNKSKNVNRNHDSTDFNDKMLLRNIKIYLKFFHNRDYLNEEMSRNNISSASTNNKNLSINSANSKLPYKKSSIKIKKNSSIKESNNNMISNLQNQIDYNGDIISPSRKVSHLNINYNENKPIKNSIISMNIPKNFNLSVDKMEDKKPKEQIESLIIRQTKEKKLILDKVSPNFAEDLNYKCSELIGKEIDSFLPFDFIEYHHSHVLNFLNKNNLLVKNKEIFFTGKNGYCINYLISGTIILTLDDEVIFYVELKKISTMVENYFDKVYLCCDLAGEIMAFDKGTRDLMFVDSESINIIKPNFFKNFLNISNQKLDFEKEQLILEISYIRLLRHIYQFDYAKIIDKKEFSTNNFNLTRLDDNIKLFYDQKINLKIPIILKKRNLLKKYFFYDVRMDFTEVKNVVLKQKPRFLCLNPSKYSRKKSEKSKLNDPPEIIMYDQISNIEIKQRSIENIGLLTKTYLDSEVKEGKSLNNFNKILFFFQFLSDQNLFTNNIGVSLNIVKKINEISYFFKNSMNFEMKIKTKLISSLFFIFVYCSFAFFINTANDVIFEETKKFQDFSHLLVILKGLSLTITNSIFAIVFIKNKLEKEEFEYPLNNIIINNSVAYHIDRIQQYSEIAQKYIYDLNLLYFENSNLLFENNYNTNFADNSNKLLENDFNRNFEIQVLNYDWTISKDNYTLSKYFTFQHHFCSQLNSSDVKNSDFFLYNFTYNDYKSAISQNDRTVYYFKENVIDIINLNMNKAIISIFRNFEVYLSKNIIIVIILYISAFSIIIFYILINICLFRKRFRTLYLKYYNLFNLIKVFNNENLKKTNMIIEIISDFTEEGLNKLKKRTHFNKKSIEEKDNNQNNEITSHSNGKSKVSLGDNYPKHLIDYFFRPEKSFEYNEAEIEINNHRVFYNIFKENFRLNLDLFKKLIANSETSQNVPKPKIKKKIYSDEKHPTLIPVNPTHKLISANNNNNLCNIEESHDANNQINFFEEFKENKKSKISQFSKLFEKLNLSEIESKNNEENNKINETKITSYYNFDSNKIITLKYPIESKNSDNINNIVNETESSINKTEAFLIKNDSQNPFVYGKKIEMEIRKEKETIKTIAKKLSNLKQDSLYDLFNNQEEKQNDIKFQKEFRKPKIYGRILKFMLLIIIVIIVISVLMMDFILNNYKVVSQCSKFMNLFSQKNIFPLEILLIFKYTLINFSQARKNTEINPNINSFSSNLTLYEETLKNYKLTIEELKSNLQNNPYLSDFQDLESEFNSKSFCDRYANFTFYNQFNYYPANTNETIFDNFKMKCLKQSMGLNQFGLQQSLETMNKIIENYYGDLKNLIKQNPYLSNKIDNFRNNLETGSKYKFIEQEILNNIQSQLKNISHSFTTDFSYGEINFNLNEIIFETWLYQLNYVYDFLLEKEEEISQNHDIIHSMLYLIVSITVIVDLLAYYFIIEKAKHLHDFAFSVIENSIKYNIFDI